MRGVSNHAATSFETREDALLRMREGLWLGKKMSFRVHASRAPE
jgi:hypothetical protein